MQTSFTPNQMIGENMLQIEAFSAFADPQTRSHFGGECASASIKREATAEARKFDA
jgi:hypothetical protein